MCSAYTFSAFHSLTSLQLTQTGSACKLHFDAAEETGRLLRLLLLDLRMMITLLTEDPLGLYLRLSIQG